MVWYSYTQLDVLMQQWQAMGIFSVLIPFVLIFAVVYGILAKTKILGAKPGIDAVIAIAVSLLALQWDWTTRLFQAQFFQNLGLGIAILLGLIILLGLFIGEWKDTWSIVGAIIAGIVFLVVLITSYGKWSWTGTSWWNAYGGLLVIVIIIAVVIFLVVGVPALGGKKQGP